MHPIPTRALLLLLTLSSLVSAVDFDSCLRVYRNDPNATGGVDSQGHLTADLTKVVGLTFEACKRYCGPTAYVYSVGELAALFSSWLIPWLALISELPFGSGNYNDDFISGEPSHRFIVALTTYKNEISCLECWVSRTARILPHPHFPKHSVGLSKGETRPAQG